MDVQEKGKLTKDASRRPKWEVGKMSPTFGLDGRLNIQSIPLGVKVGVGFDGSICTWRCGMLKFEDKQAP